MPYPNEHACRVRDPADFRRGSFRRVRRKSGARPLDAIVGRIAEDGSAMVLQSYRYPKDDWTSSQARRHCRDHEGIKFEPAKAGRGAECEPCKGEPMSEPTPHRREVILERRETPDTKGGYRATIFVNERARQGPDLSIEGLQTENYMRNPVVLWSHDMSGKTQSAGLPIGRTNRMTNADGKIEVDFEFLDGDPFADRVRHAWDKGFLKAASVSWLPLESEEAEDGNQRDIRSDLLEWSIVSVPSDPDAIRQAHSRIMDSLLTEELTASEVDELFTDYEGRQDDTADEPTRESTDHPCWESNDNCVVRAAMGSGATQEPEETSTEESSAEEERLLRIAQDISKRLRGA